MVVPFFLSITSYKFWHSKNLTIRDSNGYAYDF